MEAISKHHELWPRYFSDFILHKMKLESTDTGEGIAQRILESFFEQLHSQDVLLRMVILHTYLHVYQLDLAKMAGTFRPLNKIQKVSVWNGEWGMGKENAMGNGEGKREGRGVSISR